MSMCICRVEKIGSPKDIAGYQIHNRRERDHSNTNLNIDRTQTHLNYTLDVEGNIYHPNKQTPQRGYNALVNARIKEGYVGTKAIRKDAVRCCEVLFTTSGDYFTNQPAGTAQAYFKACMEFAVRRFGRENIIDATVHMDEETPHMHLDFVPLTSDGRLSAKSVLGGRKDMQQLQDDFYEQVGKKFGLERGVRADLDADEQAPPRKHISTQQLKAQTAQQLAEQERQIAENSGRLAALQLQVAEAQSAALAADQRAELAKKRAEEAEQELQALRGKVLSTQELAAIEGKKSIGGALKNVPWEQWQAVKATAEQAATATEQAARLKKENEQLKSDNQTLTERNKSLYYQLNSSLSPHNLEHLREKTDLRNQVNQEKQSRERLERFCESIKFSDGKSVLERFAEQEQQRQHRTKGRGQPR